MCTPGNLPSLKKRHYEHQAEIKPATDDSGEHFIAVELGLDIDTIMENCSNLSRTRKAIHERGPGWTNWKLIWRTG